MAIHVGALLVVLLLPGMMLAVRCLVSLAILVSLIHSLSVYSGYPAKTQITTLYWREFGGWEAITGAAEHLPVILLDSSFSSLHLSVLNFKTRQALGGRRYTVILLPDNCDAITRRYLRMRMKLLKIQPTEPSR